MAKLRSKKCPYCDKRFVPIPQCGSRQKCCGKKTCQKLLKKDSQKHWEKNNPHYFKNRYQTSTKPWLKQHPGYLKQYRAEHPEYVEKNRRKQKIRRQKAAVLDVDIQDVLFVQHIADQRDMRNVAKIDIQDESFLYLAVITGLMSHLRRVDIQDELDIPLCSVYNRGRFLLQRYTPL